MIGGGGVSKMEAAAARRRRRTALVPVNYPQVPLIKQVLYLYCMMDTAENINVWRSLAWTRSN